MGDAKLRVVFLWWMRNVGDMGRHQEPDIPQTLFKVYENQKKELLQLNEKFGSIVPMDKLI